MRIPLNTETLAAQTSAIIHGNDAHGFWDIEFPSVYDAVAFASTVKVIGWMADFRDPVQSVHSTVVLMVREMEGTCKSCGEKYCAPDVLNFDCLKY